MAAKEEAARLTQSIVDELCDRSIVTGKPIRTLVFELLECRIRMSQAHGWREELIARVRALSKISGIHVEDLLRCLLFNEQSHMFAQYDYVISVMATSETKAALELKMADLAEARLILERAMEEIKEEEEKMKAMAVAMEKSTQAENTSFWKKLLGGKKNKSSAADQADGIAEEGSVEKKVHAPKVWEKIRRFLIPTSGFCNARL